LRLVLVLLRLLLVQVHLLDLLRLLPDQLLLIFLEIVQL
jgi:hypothetical protein